MGEGVNEGGGRGEDGRREGQGGRRREWVRGLSHESKCLPVEGNVNR